MGACFPPRVQAEMRLILLVPLLLASGPGSSAPEARQQSDTWGPWGEWSSCSRTCGGGISFRERPCYSQRRDGGASCVGPARSYRTCRTESCPDGARDFRAEQCAELDGASFHGRRYRWLPYYGAPNKCELNCIPKGENFYYKHREAVLDGTPCEPGGRDVCVDGRCRVVGCDQELDSSKQEDKCLQCGGDGTTCYPVTGTFSANDLSRGYNRIFIIPPGATSIRIEEAAASRNFLAVRSVRGEYYLNGHWTIAEAKALPVASTVLHYERGAEGDLAPERLQARGPTSEPLIIELISQEANPGVRYEYYLPLRSPGPSPAFGWSYTSWGDCSAECGGGQQSRLVFCASDSEAYPSHMCQRQPRPADRRPCNPQPCPQTKRTSYLYRPGAWRHAGAQRVCGNSWKVGPWAPCSASCGGGSQSRPVYCVSSDGAGGQEAAEEAECAGLPGKPPSTQACNLHRCVAWSAGPWGECSVTCGAGIRRRSVACQGDEGSLLPASACSGQDRPPLTETCARAACPLPGDQAWRVSAWGLCSKSCSSGTRRRQVVCALGPPGHCRNLQQSKPRDVELCNTQPCHLPQEVPSVQDPRTPPRGPWMPSGPREALASDSRDQRPWVPTRPGGVHGSPPSAPGPNPSLQQPPRSGSGARDCRHSPYGCCPDGRTASPRPQGQGCPRTQVWCEQSRYGCCPDGVSAAEGPQQAGCTGAYGSNDAGRRPGSKVVPSTAPKAHRPQAQQNEPAECRGSQFGCCYDNVASAAGPRGEGCEGQPSSAYPVRCLLPSAHGSCADWAPRWYFVASVGLCNRFWYGGCHGNANNFASEQECMNSCRGAQHGPPHPEPGATGPGIPTDGRGSGPRGRQETSRHRTEDTVPRQPLPSGGPWPRGQQPVPGEAQPTRAFGERPGHQEVGPRTPGLGRDARWPMPPSPSSSYRISVAGSEPTVVQGAPGQSVQLFCPRAASLSPQAGWQKDGQPISSDRHHLQPDGSLVISPLRAEDAGSYSCGASGPGRDSQHIQLRVTGADEAEPSYFPRARGPAQGHGPRGSAPGGDAGRPGAVPSAQPRPATRLRLDRTQPGAVDASPGQRVRLSCRADGFPPPVIEWQRDGQPLSSPRHQTQPDGSLVISRVAPEDGGFYACVAFNGQDRDQRWVQLRVLGELTITGLPPTVTVPEGGTARLPCVVGDGSVNIRWSRNGLPVPAAGRRVHQAPDGTLLIHNLRAQDEGSYTCSAYRGSQAVSRSTEVKVAAPAAAAQPQAPSGDCVDQPELANCDLILQAQLCSNEYYASFCCASCARVQPHARPAPQQG
ncbi:PREDICTED: papilin isoform X1 [Chinchilla lanigera]|uniref:Papilin n=2 Tax=Chinchilla lanigera TaxID=34839 RepID=A0A8C2V1G2_CHILA|nr:PREDICTED: papilin isoform X1 [Chinchilla lanigera]XP_013362609.1 PREDICTED: papilin isoform X1 [Chinchilla lanigera]